MKIKQMKKAGISLIVLVITIIVMIILAAAIILSLEGSGIIGKANKAKTETDLANMKEFAVVLIAEYELGVQTGKIDPNLTSVNDYVKSGMEKSNMDVSGIAITEEGEFLTGLSELAVKFVEAGVRIGDVVEGYDLSETASYTTDGKENTYSYNSSLDEEVEGEPRPKTITRKGDMTWKYIGIGDEGEALIALDITNTTPQIGLGGKSGYLNAAQTLNTVCYNLYSSDKGTARSMNLDDVIRILEYTGDKGGYYIAHSERVTIPNSVTIGELEKELGVTLSFRITPDGRELSTYKANYYVIRDTSSDIKAGSLAKSVVYQPRQYWLATPCVQTMFYDKADYPYDDCAYFEMRVANSNAVSGYPLCYSTGQPSQSGWCLRPVVALADTVDFEYDGTTLDLK